jgi:Predicted RNA-binding protein (contains KH domains)
MSHAILSARLQKYFFAMVVAHTSSACGPSSVPRKNRRKISKKTPRIADTAGHDDNDEEMSEVPTSGATAQPIASESTGASDDQLLISMDPSSLPQPTSAPAFPPLPANAGKSALKSETRRIAIPPHRMTPLKKDWINIFGPLTEILGLQVRMNIQRKCVEARVCVSPVLVFLESSHPV